MSKRTYHGSCQCGRVKFEVDLDLSEGTSKCNCTFCWKRRWWGARAKPEDFRLIAGETELSQALPASEAGRRDFCKHCGVTPYTSVYAAEWNDGAYYSINVATLDDLTPEELLASPVTFCDGLANNWWEAPAETRYL